MTVMAEVRALSPRIRMVAIALPDEAKRRELLHDLALTLTREDCKPEVVALHLAAWAWDEFTPLQRQAAWLEYRYRLMVWQDADDGCAEWYPHLFEDPPGPDSREAAVQRAHDDADEALTVLARGSHSTNGGTR